MTDTLTRKGHTSMTALAGRTFGALLFDMDGTILSSIKAAERVWTIWAKRHGLDVASFIPTIHGVKTVETIRRLGLPDVDPEAEAKDITRAEIEDIEGIEQITGAAGFLGALPEDRWAIVTSASLPLALRRIEAAHLPIPKVLVTAEDVTHGKPAPDCYRLAAARLGQNPEDCLVFEDAPAGIAAGEAAGASVIVVTAAHTHRIETALSTIDDYGSLVVSITEGGRLSVKPVR